MKIKLQVCESTISKMLVNYKDRRICKFLHIKSAASIGIDGCKIIRNRYFIIGIAPKIAKYVNTVKTYKSRIIDGRVERFNSI